jgi:hypothetical protein
MPISLRKRLSDAYPELKLSDGIVRGGLAGAYLEGKNATDVEMFPHASLRRLASAALWPKSDITKVSDNPIAAESVWTDELNGLTYDAEFWYAVTKTKVFRIPRSVPLQDAKGSKVQAPSIAPGWPHGGGCSLFNGHLYVAVHGESGGAPKTGEVWVVRTSDLLVIDRIALPHPELPIQDPTLDTVPFVAIHPRKPLLYSMPFTPEKGAQLRVYRLYPHPGGPGPDGSRLKFLAAVTLTDEKGNIASLAQIQNAVVTPNEHLLVMCDSQDSRRGLHLFDLLSGRRRWHRDVGVRTTEWDFNILFWDFHFKGWEAEALFIKEMGVDGLIHVGNLDKISDTDDLTVSNLDFVDDYDRDLL